MLERPYLVFVPGAGAEWTAYLHVASGQGRSTRRRLIGVYHGAGPLTKRSLPDVLRQIAQAMETSPGLGAVRDLTKGSGAPGGGVGV